MTKPQQQRNFSLYFSWYLPMLCNATRYNILHNISHKHWQFSSRPTCSRNDQNTGCVVSIPSSFLSPLVLKGKLRKMWIWCWVQIVPRPFLQAKQNPALCFDHNHITSGESVFQVKVNRKFSGSSCSNIVFSWAMSVPYNVCTFTMSVPYTV